MGMGEFDLVGLGWIGRSIGRSGGSIGRPWVAVTDGAAVAQSTVTIGRPLLLKQITPS